jgi:hypothetical protein
MKILTLFIGLLCAVQMAGQFIPVNLKLDASAGTQFMHSQITEGYEIEKVIPHVYVGGMRYLLNKNLYLRGELAVNLNRPAEGSKYFRNDYFRTTFGVSTDLLQLHFGKSPGQKNAIRLWHDKFKLFGFVGIGVSAMINKMRFEANYNKRIYVYDYMANLSASLSPTFQINYYHAVFINAMMIGHIRQAYNFDLMGSNYNPGFDGGYMITTIGYSFTPFKSMAGVRTIN